MGTCASTRAVGDADESAFTDIHSRPVHVAGLAHGGDNVPAHTSPTPRGADAAEEAPLRLAIVGAQGSGKTVLQRQLQHALDSSLSPVELVAHTDDPLHVRSAVAENVLTVLQGVLALGVQYEEHDARCEVCPELEPSVLWINELPASTPLDADVAQHVDELWQEPAVRRVFRQARRSGTFPVEEWHYTMRGGAPTLFGSVRAVGDAGADYEVTLDDVLHVYTHEGSATRVTLPINLGDEDTQPHKLEIVTFSGDLDPPAHAAAIGDAPVQMVAFCVDLSGYCLPAEPAGDDDDDSCLRVALQDFLRFTSTVLADVEAGRGAWSHVSYIEVVFSKSDVFSAQLRRAPFTCFDKSFDGDASNAQECTDFVTSLFAQSYRDATAGKPAPQLRQHVLRLTSSPQFTPVFEQVISTLHHT